MSSILDRIAGIDGLGATLGILDGEGMEGQESRGGRETSKSKTEEYLNRIENAGYDLQYMKPILEGIGNSLTNSSAGSGKTTTLIFKVGYDFIDKRMLTYGEDGMPRMSATWVGTFLKNGQRDIRNRMRAETSVIGIDLTKFINVATLDAEFRSAYIALGGSGDIVSEHDNRQLFNKAARSVLRSRGYSKEDIDAYYERVDALRGSLSVPADILGVFTEWKMLRAAQGKVDFADIQEALYRWAVIDRNEEVRDFLSSRYKRIYLDEFQDVSKLQYEILKVYALGKGEGIDLATDRSSGAVFAIGDDDQSIYSWRGSDVNYITSIYEKDFKATVYQNPVNYRTPKGILNVVTDSISRNQNRLEKSLKSAKNGGEVYYAVCSNYSQMGNVLARDVIRDIRRGLDVAILVRTNSDGLVPAMELVNKGVDFGISNQDMTLNGALGKRAMGIIDFCNNQCSDLAMEGLGAFIMNRRAEQTLRDKMLESRVGIWDIDLEDFTYSFPTLKQTFTSWRYIARNDKNNLSYITVRVLKEFLEWLSEGIQSKNDVTPWQVKCKALYDAMVTLIDTQGLETPISDFWELMNHLSDKLDSKLNVERKFSSRKSIEIATVHDYKGRETDSIYLWNDTKGTFPLKRVLDKQGIDGLEEERRIHYIACTRAREKETILTIKGREGEFYKELDLAEAEEEDTLVEQTIRLGKSVGRGGQNADELITLDEVLKDV